MDLQGLRAFVAIVDAGGVHRAAARLHLTQPAISRRIRALEAELGVPLFDRIGRRVHLTSEGDDLLRRSRDLLRHAESLAERAAALKKGESGVLRVGASPMVIEDTLAPFLSRYRRRHPGIEVQLVEDGSLRLPIRLADGDVHLALTVAVDDRFRRRLLYPAYGVAVVPKEHRLARRGTVDITDLANEPLLLLHRTFASRGWVDAACDAAHLRPRIVLESGAPHTIIALAAAGHGIAIIPSSIAIPHSTVRAVPMTRGDAAVGGWLTIAWDRHRFLAPFAERFVDEIAAYCERAHPNRELARRAPPLPRPRQPID